MNKTWVMAGGVLVLALAAGGGWMLSRQPAKAAAAAKKPETVLQFTAREVVLPQREPLAGQVEFSGPLVAPDTAIVRTRAAGTLLNLAVAEGSRVAAGQRLGTLDLSDLNARLNERQAQVASAKAQLTQAERSHASNRQLADQQFISPNALETSQATLDSARASLAAAEAQTDTVKVSLRDAALVAPLSGIVAKRHVLPGEKLAADQEVITLINLSRLEMAGSVPTHEIGRLKVGMPVQVSIEGLDAPREARLTRIAPAAEAGTRLIGVTVALDNPGEQLRAGQYAVARVRLGGGEPRLTVPVTAIVSASGQDYVWTLEQGKLVRRTVTTGLRDGERGRVEIREGLKPEVPVLAMRFENLREGAPAQVQAATAAASVPVMASASQAASPSAVTR